jgi:hypothetical protein
VLAIHGAVVSPRVDMETTDTEILVRMVENCLGVSLVPLMPNGAVTRAFINFLLSIRRDRRRGRCLQPVRFLLASAGLAVTMERATVSWMRLLSR